MDACECEERKNVSPSFLVLFSETFPQRHSNWKEKVAMMSTKRIAIAFSLAAHLSSAFQPRVLSSFAAASVTRRSSSSSISMDSGLTLYGSQQTRSPLVNWYLEEKSIPFTQKAPRPSAHPFGQTPFLTDDGGVEVFESGAILLYIADAYGGNTTPAKRASYTKWVVWANSELDGICFGKNMGGTQLDKPNKGLDTLERLLNGKDYLVDNEFSVADVAIASYLNYVPIFFSSVRKLPNRPNIGRYMIRCAQRPAFVRAFGQQHSSQVISKATEWMK